MKKLKVIVKYFFGLILSILMAFLCLVLILKSTVLNKNYLIDTMIKENYYSKIYDEINVEMEAYMMSSGFDASILKDIYTIEEVKNDVNQYVSGLFEGKKIDIEKGKIKDNIQKNIDTYLKERNVKVVNESDVQLFIEEISDIYCDEVSFYHFLDFLVGNFEKIDYLINVSIIISLIVIVLLIIMLIKSRILFSSFIASGLIIFFIVFFFQTEIMMDDVLIISLIFSSLVKNIYQTIMHYMVITSSFLIIFGIILLLINSMCKTKKKR